MDAEVRRPAYRVRAWRYPASSSPLVPRGESSTGVGGPCPIAGCHADRPAGKRSRPPRPQTAGSARRERRSGGTPPLGASQRPASLNLRHVAGRGHTPNGVKRHERPRRPELMVTLPRSPRRLDRWKAPGRSPPSSHETPHTSTWRSEQAGGPAGQAGAPSSRPAPQGPHQGPRPAFRRARAFRSDTRPAAAETTRLFHARRSPAVTGHPSRSRPSRSYEHRPPSRSVCPFLHGGGNPC